MKNVPEHGARFEIALESRTDDHATYAIAIHEAATVHDARVTIGATSIDTKWTAEPPRWIAETTQGFLKTLQKNHASDASWPARLVRWRSEK